MATKLEGGEVGFVEARGERLLDGLEPVFFVDGVNLLAKESQQSDVGATPVGELIEGEEVGLEDLSLGVESMLLLGELFGGEEQEVVGLLAGDHRAQDAGTKAHIAGDGAATLAHAAKFALFDIVSSLKRRHRQDL